MLVVQSSVGLIKFTPLAQPREILVCVCICVCVLRGRSAGRRHHRFCEVELKYVTVYIMRGQQVQTSTLYTLLTWTQTPPDPTQLQTSFEFTIIAILFSQCVWKNVYM